MQFPKRHSNHVLESASWKILQAAIPAQWLLREVTERDYGVDAYLELVANDGSVNGELVSLQLKGLSKAEWKDGCFFFPGTRKETINYWMNLPVPVFLCVADAETSRVWFVDVKDHVRRAHKEFISQKTLTFPVRDGCTFDTPTGLSRFMRAYVRERRHEQFSFDLMSLLANCLQYSEFCEGRFRRDCHLPLEPHNLIIFAHLIVIGRSVALHLGLEWNLKSLDDLLNEDRLTWQDSSCDLHEGTACRFTADFAPRLAEVIVTARKHVASDYADYWRSTDPLLFESCRENSEFSYVIDHAIKKLNQPI